MELLLYCQCILANQMLIKKVHWVIQEHITVHLRHQIFKAKTHKIHFLILSSSLLAIKFAYR
jgi:hypothetical protein